MPASAAYAHEEESCWLATQRRRRSGDGRTAQRSRTRTQTRRRDEEGIIPVLAQAVREVERAVTNRQLTSGQRSRYQAVALLARAERTRVRADDTLTDQQRDTMLKRLDGVATILAQTAAQEPSLFHLLAEDAEISDNTRRLEREMQAAAGLEPEPEPEPQSAPVATGVRPERKVLPQSVLSAQLANPFLVPDFSQAAPRVQGRLSGWELIGPLLNSFEQAAPGSSACMELPDPRPILLPKDLDLMPHQSRLLASVAEGHRTFLLADEPGPRQDRAGPAGRAGRERLPAAGDRPQRGQDQLGPRGRDVDPPPQRDRDPRRRRDRRRVRRHRGRQLRGPRPTRRLDERARLPRPGRRRGPLHQEQEVPAVAERPRGLPADPPACRPAAADGPDRHPADQRHRGLPRDLAGPRLDRGAQARQRPDGRARGDRLHPGRPRLLPGRPPGRRRPRHRASPQGRRGRRHSGPPCRRHPGRARGRGRPLHPRRRGPARPAPRRSLPGRARAPARGRIGAGRRRHRPRARTPGGRARGRRGQRGQDRRQRLHDGAQDRPGQGRARHRLRRPAGPQHRQGRLLRQAPRRHGHRRGDLRPARRPHHDDPRRPDPHGPTGRHRRASSAIRTSR